MKKKIAIVTGASGQDGAYLIELLLKKNYKVVAALRRNSNVNTSRLSTLGLDYVTNNFSKAEIEITEFTNCANIISKLKPSEFYNLAAQSFVKTSFDQPIYTTYVNSLGVLNCLESIRNFSPKTKFYQASTSEMYGNPIDKKMNEKTEFAPVSPYAVSKLYAYHMTKLYREAYKLFCVNGILFNHESPFRGQEFVTQKIITSLVKIKKNKQKFLLLGNLDSYRDWGHAKDYVQSMWLMLQQKKPSDYVVSTGKTFTIRDFVNRSAKYLGMKITWKGSGLNEIGYDTISNKQIIKISKQFYRPAEVNYLRGDPSKAKRVLKWKPKYNLDSLIADMCEVALKKY